MRTGVRTNVMIAAAWVAGLVYTAAVGADEAVVVVKAGKVITVSGEEIPQGEIVIVDGKIRLVGRKLEYPKGATIIDAPGETVMPGMIHLRARTDAPTYQRSGIRGNLKVADEVNLSEVDFEPFVKNGFTAAVWMPMGTGLPGMPAIYRTGGPADEQVIDAPGYVRFTMNSQPRDKQGLRDALKKAKTEIEKVEKAKKDLEEKKKKDEEAAKKAAEEKKDAPAPAPTPGPAPNPVQGPPPLPTPPVPTPPVPSPGSKPGEAAKPGEPETKLPEIDPAYRPLTDLLEKKAGAARLVLEINKSADILHAQDVLQDYEAISPVYYMGGFPGQADYNYIVAKLVEGKTMVVMPPSLHRLPQTSKRYNPACELMFEGIDVAYVPASDSAFELENYREKAADVARAGGERVPTLRAITINPAKIAGLDKRLGTIEKGKDADLVFLSGDPLDPASRVTRVMILGTIAWDAKKEASR